MKTAIVLSMLLTLSACAQGQYSVRHKQTAVDVSTLRATDITVRDECTQPNAPPAIEVKPKQFVTPGQLGDFLAQGAAIMCGVTP